MHNSCSDISERLHMNGLLMHRSCFFLPKYRPRLLFLALLFHRLVAITPVFICAESVKPFFSLSAHFLLFFFIPVGQAKGITLKTNVLLLRGKNKIPLYMILNQEEGATNDRQRT